MWVDGFNLSDFDDPSRVSELHKTDVIAVIYDVTDSRSFENVKQYFDKLLLSRYDGRKVVVLVGNKKDAPGRKISSEAIRNFIRRQAYSIEYLESSAKSGDGVDNLFWKAVNKGITPQKLAWIRRRVFLFVHYNLTTRIPPPVATPNRNIFGNMWTAIPGAFKKNQINRRKKD